ncbi:MAG TPA: DUF4443 domain-containing protein [Nitrososphaerales archaeon]|nr:DUF4443 domain-containing protein [Nitrososphaerales archaeon]
MPSLSSLLQISERPIQGPPASFERAHLLLAFITIGESGVIGRQSLAVRSGLGLGAVRTVIKKLREDGYAGTTASGCYLTAAGKRVYRSTQEKFSPIVLLDGSNLTVGDSQVGMAVRGVARNLKAGLEQRDAAVKVGGTGASTYVMKSGKFAIPGGSSDCEKDFPSKVWSSLRDQFSPKNGDAVILCGARDETTAKLGALSAALTLV